MASIHSDTSEHSRQFSQALGDAVVRIWGVLPPELRQPELAAGIAEELKWFEGLVTSPAA